MRLAFSESAVQDLSRIKAYYLEKGVPEIGRRFVQEIIERTEGLLVNPDLGRVVPEFNQSTIREVIHPPFRIVYQRSQTELHVIRVWRSERLLVLPEKSQ